jgi:spore maturation protein CgeB
MRVTIFCHSLISDWNHGNAHFLRGVASELMARGHALRIYEPHDAWSLQNLSAEQGDDAVLRFHSAFPALRSTRYDLARLDLDEALEAELVLVHEWNDPGLVSRIGAHNPSRRRAKILFHDTHHRTATDSAAMSAYDLSNYDGVLAFGEAIRQVYIGNGWSHRAWTWHEAADIRVFRPLAGVEREGDLIWIGNWGDGERTAELQEFLFGPAHDLRLRSRIHGVRYPGHALTTLAAYGIEYGGWLPNYEVPRAFAAFRMTVHVPRGPYVRKLSGIPTIRVFEALACGIPLVSAPWDDAEGLFNPGLDYLVARDGSAMCAHLRALLHDRSLAENLAAHGLETILARHTCAHRVNELAGIAQDLGIQAESPLIQANV